MIIQTFICIAFNTLAGEYPYAETAATSTPVCGTLKPRRGAGERSLIT